MHCKAQLVFELFRKDATSKPLSNADHQLSAMGAAKGAVL